MIKQSTIGSDDCARVSDVLRVLHRHFGLFMKQEKKQSSSVKTFVPSTQMRMENSFNNRTQNLFKNLVEQYLTEGAPVGSKTLVESSKLEISAATVRNIMSDLESYGLVASPHTSAGKVPTQQGLRFFVDSLISVQPLDTESIQYLTDQLGGDLSPNELVESASNLLSDVSHLAGLVTMPRPEQVALRQVEFLPLSGNRVLAILVVNEREVQNRVVETEREYTDLELQEAANYINHNFAGRSLLTIRTDILDSMQSDKDRMDTLMQTAIDVGGKTFDDPNEKAYVVTGERNLMNFLTSSLEVRNLLDAFTEKGAIVHLLDKCVETEGVQLFIGGESGYRPLDSYSLITAPYESHGSVAGVLGIIGPTRMNYQKVIPLVDVTAKLLGSAMDLGRT